MTKYAIISDIHGNLPALEAALTDIEKQEVDEIVCLGDIVGYGPDPLATWKKVKELHDKGRINHLVIGNHEEGVLDFLEEPDKMRFDPQVYHDYSGKLNKHAYVGILHAVKELMGIKEKLDYSKLEDREKIVDAVQRFNKSPEKYSEANDLVKWLEQFRPTENSRHGKVIRTDQGYYMGFYHDNPFENDGKYIIDNEAHPKYKEEKYKDLVLTPQEVFDRWGEIVPSNIKVVVTGHTHRWLAETNDSKLLLNPGSVGAPRDSKNGSYLIFNTQTAEYEQRLVVGVDFNEIKRRAKALGLPNPYKDK